MARRVFIFLLAIICVYHLRDLHFSNQLSFSMPRLLSEQKKQELCTDINFDPLSETFQGKKSVESLFDLIKVSRGGNKLIEALDKYQNTKDSQIEVWAQYLNSFFTLIVVFACVLLISLISWICFFCYCCCTSCPICCKRNYEEHPFTKKEKQWPATCSVFLILGVLACCTAGMIFNKNVNISYKQVGCSLYTSFSDFIYGVPQETSFKWIGLTNVSQRLNILIKQLEINRESFAAIQDTSPVEEAGRKIQASIINIYKNNKASVVTSPDPRKTTKVAPDAIMNLGPPNDNSTLTGLLNSEYNKYNGFFIKTVADLKNGSAEISKNIDSYLNQISVSQSQLRDFNQEMTDLDRESTDFMDTILVYISLSLTIFLMVIAMVGVCCVGFCQNNGTACKMLMNLSWTILPFFVIVGFLVSSITFPSTIAAMEACEVLNITFTDTKGFRRWTSFIDEDVKGKLGVCFFEDGDINRIFNLRGIFTKIDDVYSSVGRFNISNISDTNQGLETKQSLEKQKYFLESAIKTEKLDGNPDFSLKSLNLWSDFSLDSSRQNSLGCKVSLDEWVMNNTLCRYQKPFNKSLGTNASFGDPVCINLNDLSSSELSSRINGKYPCSNQVVQNIQGYHDTLASYQRELGPVFDKLIADIDVFIKQNNQISGTLKAIQTNITNNFVKLVTVLLDEISNDKTGLLKSVNCTFFKKSVDSFQESVCLTFIPSVFQLSVLLIFYSSFAYFATFCLLCTVLRNSHEEEEDLASMLKRGSVKNDQNTDKKMDQPMRTRSIGNIYTVNDYELSESYK